MVSCLESFGDWVENCDLPGLLSRKFRKRVDNCDLPGYPEAFMVSFQECLEIGLGARDLPGYPEGIMVNCLEGSGRGWVTDLPGYPEAFMVSFLECLGIGWVTVTFLGTQRLKWLIV